jgi:hypothetical protein
MDRMISFVLTASALVFGIFLSGGEVVAQTARDIVGMWTLVSVTLEQDGKKTNMYGANPQGQAIFAPNGRFLIMFIRSDVPRFASGNREAGTPKENRAAVRGSIAYFGAYSVSETHRVIIYHVEGSTFPNWRDADQKRLFKLSGGELTLTNPVPSNGSGTGYSVWKRVK